jgi:cytoskeletal protein RodZ
MAFGLLFPVVASAGRRSGCPLIESTQAVVQVSEPTIKPKRKHSLLPTLIVLFLVSYGLMCLLTVEQDQTIAAQRSLIGSLLSDSSELSHLKVKIFQDQHPQPDAGTNSRDQQPSTQTPSTQAPSAQAPSTRTPSTQAPMTQEAPAGSSQRSHVAGKVKKSVPMKPPLGIADIVDGRRIAKTI